MYFGNKRVRLCRCVLVCCFCKNVACAEWGTMKLPHFNTRGAGGMCRTPDTVSVCTSLSVSWYVWAVHTKYAHVHMHGTVPEASSCAQHIRRSIRTIRLQSTFRAHCSPGTCRTGFHSPHHTRFHCKNYTKSLQHLLSSHVRCNLRSNHNHRNRCSARDLHYAIVSGECYPVLFIWILYT
jgi:hypothetical protein